MLLSRFSRVWLCDPIDGSPPVSTVPGILQARTLEWVAISFSSAWKWKGKVKSLSRIWLLATPWTAGHHAALSMGFSRQEYWSGLPLPSMREAQNLGLRAHTKQKWAGSSHQLVSELAQHASPPSPLVSSLSLTLQAANTRPTGRTQEKSGS